jgi:hypothetical protein
MRPILRLRLMPKRWRQLAMSTLLAALVLPAPANDLLKMTEQLDRLDRTEMLALLEKAETCVQSNDFPCAEAQLAKARKFARSGQNVGDWTRVSGVLDRAKTRVALARLAQQQAEEEAARERRRIAREEEEERERERRREERLAARERERDEAREAQPSTASQMLGAFNATIQNYNNFNAQVNAQQQAIQRQANAARARESEAERIRQHAAQRLADERSRIDEQRAARERRQQDTATAEKSRADQARAEANAERERAQRAQAEQEERKRTLLAEQAAQREREQRAAETRQRQEREKAERMAKQEADKAAAEKQMADFYAAMARGIRLVAINCFGQHSATGTLPKLKEPSGGSCIDVNYEASCPDNRPPIRGVAKNFVGMAGCFGDTYEFSPKPACDIKDVRVRVTSVQGCS